MGSSIGNKVVRLRETSLFSDANLVSYWSLDGNANDIKGSNHGIPTSCDFGAIGKFDKSCGFNGTTSGIVTTNNIGISGNAIFTISCWAKFDTNTTVKIVDCGVNGSATGFCIMYGGTISAFFYNSNFVTTTESFSTNIWHHIAVTRTTGFANNAKIYVDGLYRNVVVAGMTTANITNTTLSIGYGKTVGGYYVDGNIDDIAYFNRVLTADEIFLLYTGCQNREFIGNRFYISPQAGKSSVELIPYQVDRDFSGANHWTNINFPIFNSSGDLSLGSQASLYRECNIALDCDDKIHDVIILTFVCTIFPIQIFKDISKPWFKKSLLLSIDTFFSQKIINAGYRLLVDTSIKCGVYPSGNMGTSGVN